MASRRKLAAVLLDLSDAKSIVDEFYDVLCTKECGTRRAVCVVASQDVDKPRWTTWNQNVTRLKRPFPLRFFASVVMLKLQYRHCGHLEISVFCRLSTGRQRRFIRNTPGSADLLRKTQSGILSISLPFLPKKEKFTEHPRNSSIFGVSFQGLETDFETLSRLTAYYDAVDRRFSNSRAA